MEINKLNVRVRLKTQFHEVINERDDVLRQISDMMMYVSEEDLHGEDFNGMIKQLFDEKEESMEMCTEGELYFGDGRIEIRYVEPEISDMGDSVTAVSFEETAPELVAVMRGGDVYTALILERGVRHACVYSTSLMPITIYTTAKQLENRLGKDGGELIAVYTVETQEGVVQFNRMCMTVTPVNG